MEFEEIRDLVTAPHPSWLPRGQDHTFAIPGTKSYAYYPYEFGAGDEDVLSRLCSEHGYTLVRKPKEESEYHPAAYKILILEPGYDDEKIECGCGLIAKFIRIFKARGEAGTLDQSHLAEFLDVMDDALQDNNKGG